MPTVHLAIPDKTYEELRARASEMGIQVTDLIKLYIKMGLEKGPAEENGATHALSRKVDKVERELKLKSTYLEGKIRELEETLSYIIERLEILEESVGEYSSRKRVEESV
ncbi:MAG: hypothetical protein NZ902_05930 [Acidilobaceae archaeon]|nr:hypothetical protein [Acidilobaceae archaeon]MCX8166104.1 hypothetical protein [Acidilobaceae archaeon]MDW7974747.1 hypothetical protein [Sulfolobales archaeon]